MILATAIVAVAIAAAIVIGCGLIAGAIHRLAKTLDQFLFRNR